MRRAVPVLALLLAACPVDEAPPDAQLPDDDDSAWAEPGCDPPCAPDSEACVDDTCVCADGYHDDGRQAGICVPEGVCADGWGIPEGEADCVPIEDFCSDETCHLLVGWDGECLYEVSDDLTPCEGTSPDPCDTEFVCQAGACVPAPRTCSPLRPVLFVHGVNGSSADFEALAARLVADGWPMEFLFFFDAEDPSWGCNMDNAAVIDLLADQVMDQTCEPRIDLVAHSMGTLSSRWFVKNLGGTELVNVYATIGGMHHGLLSPCFAPDFLGVCVWQEICEWGDMVTQLNEPPATPGELAWVSIYGTADETIPNDSSHLEGAENIVIEGATHVGLLDHDEAYAELRRVLEYPCW